jgi:hypothetical protein
MLFVLYIQLIQITTTLVKSFNTRNMFQLKLRDYENFKSIKKIPVHVYFRKRHTDLGHNEGTYFMQLLYTAFLLQVRI